MDVNAHTISDKSNHFQNWDFIYDFYIFRFYGDIDFICHQEHVCLEVKTFFVADSKAGSLCCSHKTVGRQHNANILYFTANCGGGGVETIGIWNGRTQEGSKINWSRFLSLWPSKDQLILALPTPLSLFWYLGKIGGGYCSGVALLRQVSQVLFGPVCHSLLESCSYTFLFCFSIGVDLVLVMTWICFSHVVDRPHRRHNHGCHCSGCNLKSRCIFQKKICKSKKR